MIVRLRLLQARVLPQGWLDVARQLALFGVAYLAYGLARGLVSGSATDAFTHARELIGMERTLHVFVEPSIQAWASGSRLLMAISSWLYLNAQTTVTVGALVYLYLRHNGSFYFVRNMLMISMLLALVVYAVFPTAPPRFMPEWGFVDSVADFTGIHNNHESATMSVLFNPYAAVPSMHVAFALSIGWPLARLVRWRPLKAFWFVYPALVAFVIVATANHFILDAFLGALTAAAAAYGAAWLARARPAAWRFTPLPAGAGGASASG